MNVLITLGRLPKGLELARAFAGAGCRVIVAEPHRWHLSRISRAVTRTHRVTAPNLDLDAYLDELADVVRRESVDLVVPVSDETMYVAALRDRLPASVRLYCPPEARIIELHDKLRFIRLAQACGLPVPQTHALGEAGAGGLLGRSRCIVKPRWSSAGAGLQVLEAGSAVPRADTRAPAVVQAWVPGDEISTFSIVDAGRTIGTVVYRGLIMSGTVAVCFERLEEPPRDVLEWVERFAAATDHDGFLSFDMRMDAGGRPLAIECNPRTTSGIHFVDPGDLAAAILTPSDTKCLRTRPQRRLQQFYPALTEVQIGAFRGEPVREPLRHLFATPDVCWQVRDPLPLLVQPVVSWEILGRSLFRGESFGEASTVDIAWHGPVAG